MNIRQITNAIIDLRSNIKKLRLANEYDLEVIKNIAEIDEITWFYDSPTKTDTLHDRVAQARFSIESRNNTIRDTVATIKALEKELKEKALYDSAKKMAIKAIEELVLE